MGRYELLDHTADIGITAFGRDLPEVFSVAAHAMFDILTDTDRIEEASDFDLQISAANVEELLVTWLAELLYRYETERFICKRFAISNMDSTGLCASVFGEELDPARHEIKTEIKSITYHQLKVEKAGNEWKAQVVFDV